MGNKIVLVLVIVLVIGPLACRQPARSTPDYEHDYEYEHDDDSDFGRVFVRGPIP